MSRTVSKEFEMTRKILVPTSSDSFDDIAVFPPRQFEDVLKASAFLLEKNIWIYRRTLIAPKRGNPQWRIITNTEEQQIPDDGSVESENLLQAAAKAIELPYPIPGLDNYCVLSVTRIITTADKSKWIDLCSFDGPGGRTRHYQILSTIKRDNSVPGMALAALYCLAHTQKGDKPTAAGLFRHLPESVKSTCKQLENKIFLTEELPLGSTISRFHGLEACLREPTVLNLRNVYTGGMRPSVRRYTIELSAVLKYLKTLSAHRLERVEVVDLQSTNLHNADLKYLLEIDTLIASSVKPCVFNLSGTRLSGSVTENFRKELSTLLLHNIVLVANTFFAKDVEAGKLDILHNENLKFYK